MQESKKWKERENQFAKKSSFSLTVDSIAKIEFDVRWEISSPLDFVLSHAVVEAC